MARKLQLVALLFGVLLLTTVITKAEEEAEDGKEDEESEEEDDIDYEHEPEPEPKVPEDGLEREDFVIVLTDDNFDEVINSKDNILVEFYAPWCGHCKSLAPKYAEAAKELARTDPELFLAKLDATENKNAAEKYEVSGYPTLKYFKKGQVYEYDGPREAYGITEFMRERADPDWKPPPSKVLTLTKDNFTETVDNAELILVEFYAPWCGHCKQLAPEYEEAAKQLAELENPIPLAKVDATVEDEIAKKYDVSGYPTLKIFRKGTEYEYKGERSSYGIVEYMEKQQGDASKEYKTLKDLKAAMNDEDVTVVGFFSSKEDKAYEIYQNAANDLRDEFTMMHTFDETTRDNYRANAGTVGVFNAPRYYTKFEPKWHLLDKVADRKPSELQDFIKKHQRPLVGFYDWGTKDKRYTNRPLCLFFYTVDFSHDGKIATQLWRNKAAEIAKDFPDLTFAIANEEDQSDLVQGLGFDESGAEMNIGCIGEGERKYPMEEMDEWDSDTITEFFTDFKNGKIQGRVRSQPIPKNQKGPVKVVVGKNFEDIVFNSEKDVLIELYAPWCGHCKELEPKYKKLAKRLQTETNLVIAKMDATANDSPKEYSASGFPTIYFAPANNKQKPIKYEGAREPEDFEKFLKEHSVNSFGKSLKDEL